MWPPHSPRIRALQRAIQYTIWPLIGLGLAACGQSHGTGNPNGPPDAGVGSDGAALPVECQAQRAVHLVGGNGGLAWFTLEWPLPGVITGFQPSYAFDSPANAKNVGTDPAHPLYVRTIGTRAVWEGLGQAPFPSAFIAGTNEAHTIAPSSTRRSNGIDLAAAGAALQASLKPMVPVLVFGNNLYGTTPGAPAPVNVADLNSAIALFPPAIQDQVRPSAAQMSAYLPASGTSVEVALATQLAFTANAFRLGLLGTVVMPALSDDPHTAFAAGPPTVRANNLATMLDMFYHDLSTSSETTCGHGGNPLSLADNVVTVVTGDTPKNSFNSAGWPDGTAGLANFVYVRSNGFTRPGWFGALDANTRTNFNPSTGALDPTAAVAASTAAMFAGTLYAIARGDKTKLTPFTTAAYDGVILP